MTRWAPSFEPPPTEATSPLTTSAFLREQGIPPKMFAKIAAEFDASVHQAYRGLEHRAPEEVDIVTTTGEIASVAVYPDRARTLMLEVLMTCF